MSRQSEILSRYTSLFNSKNVDVFESETTKKVDNLDFIDFLFEIIRVTKGKKEFKNIILKGSLNQVKNSDDINNFITDSIFVEFGCDQNLLIPTKFTTKSILGLQVNKSKIDPFSILNTNPNEAPFSYLYDGTNIEKNINYGIHQAQSGEAITYKHKGRVLYEITFDNDILNFKFGEYYENKLFLEWLKDYLQEANPIFNFATFLTVLTDIITGAISVKANKNLIETKKEVGFIRALKKIFGFCNEVNENNVTDSSNQILQQQQNNNQNNFNGDVFINNQSGVGGNISTNNVNNPFNFSFIDYEEIELESTLKHNNTIRFKSCGDLDITVNSDDIVNGLINMIEESNRTAFYTYDDNNQQITTVSQNNTDLIENKVPNIDVSTNFFSDSINKGIIDIINSGESNTNISIPDIEAEFQLNILKSIPYSLTQMILTPKIMLIPVLFCKLSGDGECDLNVNDYIVNMRKPITKIGKNVTDLIVKNIFDTIMSDIRKLAKDMAIQFLKQRGVDYLLALRSLTAFLSVFDINTNSCTSILDTLLRALKLSNFGPMPMLPPPLVLIGGAFKSGLNSVSIVNDIKSNLISKGIETGGTLPDGSPNNMMIAIEETVKTLINHIKSNAMVQTFGMSAAGPVQGYAQIQ